MASPLTIKNSLLISLSVGAILPGISRVSNWKCELSLKAPGQGAFVTYIGLCSWRSNRPGNCALRAEIHPNENCTINDYRYSRLRIRENNLALEFGVGNSIEQHNIKDIYYQVGVPATVQFSAVAVL